MTDTSRLAGRLREILQSGSRSRAAVPPGPPTSSDDVDRILDGRWHETDRGRCLLVERSARSNQRYGRYRIGDLAEHIRRGTADAGLIAAGAHAEPYVFLDLETTGLGGGAGNTAFLIGMGWFDADDAFVTRQYLLPRTGDERTMLDALQERLSTAGTLVSFNGKSFDVPMLETRHAFHRMDWPATGGRIPHLDALHPARRFWGETGARCSLDMLERGVLGATRVGDVSGFEIPQRYFGYVRTGDARPLASVLDHNRLDLLSLAGVTARLLTLIRVGPEDAAGAREALALGHFYRQSGQHTRAREAFERAITIGGDSVSLVDALRALAVGERQARRHVEAARLWEGVLAVPDCPPRTRCEAAEALAVHHEHRVRDLAAARRFALRTLEHGVPRGWSDAARYRLARIERKMQRRPLLARAEADELRS